MEIKIVEQKSLLKNEDIKWYLLDEQLWATKLQQYSEIEHSIENSIGSFNWLYDVNDTVLFNKFNHSLETVIINLSGKTSVDYAENSNIRYKNNKIKGNIFLYDASYMNYEFRGKVVYSVSQDCLYAFQKEKGTNIIFLFVTDDFGFVVEDGQLEGWILKNACQHLYLEDEKITNINKKALAKYLNAIEMLDNDNSEGFERTVMEMDLYDDSFGKKLKDLLVDMQ
jgi:hypothetical protein